MQVRTAVRSSVLWLLVAKAHCNFFFLAALMQGSWAVFYPKQWGLQTSLLLGTFFSSLLSNHYLKPTTVICLNSISQK